MPTSTPAQLEVAENNFATNRLAEAQQQLAVLSLSRDEDVRLRASLLLTRLQCGRNFFDRPMAWAPVYFSASSTSTASEPRSLDWVLDELEKQRNILAAAETQLSYRKERRQEKERVNAAYESEIKELDEQRRESRAAIDDYEKAIKSLEERLKLLERFGQEIESKMREAQQSLLQLPNDVARDAEAITTALGGGISNILAAGTSYGEGNIPGVLSNLGNVCSQKGN